MKQCRRCGKEHDGKYGSGRFCSKSCANARTHTPETCEKISNSLKKSEKFRSVITSEQNRKKRGDGVKKAREFGSYDHINWSNVVSKGTIGKYNKSPNNIFDLSRRTVSKIIHRIEKEEGIGCCICGWNQGTCHIHHINGRKISNPHNHENLSLVCPNCHCLVHEGKISKDDLKNLKEHIGDLWKKYYFG